MGERRMASTKCRWQCPEDWSEWSVRLAAGLHARNRWRLPVLLAGILFAHGRRTVTTSLRDAGVGADFRDHSYLVAAHVTPFSASCGIAGLMNGDRFAV